MQVRTSFVKDMLKEVEADPQAAAILARLGADVVARIRADTPLTWTDAADFEQILVAVRAVAGDDGLSTLSRRHFLRFRENPLLKSTIDALVRVFGLSPHLLLRGVPRGRASVVREAGEVTWERLSDTSCKLLVRGFFPLSFDCALINLAGSWHGALELCRTVGTIVVERKDAAAGDADFVVRW